MTPSIAKDYEMINFLEVYHRTKNRLEYVRIYSKQII